MKASVILTALATATLFAATASIATAQTAIQRSPQTNRATFGIGDRPSGNPDRLAAPGSGDSHGIVTTCEGVQSCNDFIALCVASGGDFTPTGHDGEGRPNKGECDN